MLVCKECGNKEYFVVGEPCVYYSQARQYEDGFLEAIKQVDRESTGVDSYYCRSCKVEVFEKSTE